MRKQMIENAALEVATQVRAVEDSIEAALAELAELQARMIHARSVTGVAFTTGQSAFEHVVTTASGLVAARGGIAHCHAVLAETRKTIPGLRTVAIGDGDECPPAAAHADLRIVA